MKVDLNKIIEAGAKKALVEVVVCEGWDERCLQASADVIKKGLAKITLLGNPDKIAKKAKELKVDVSQAKIVDFKNSELKDELAEKLVEVRKHKGLKLEQAQKLLEDENYFGCMYVLAGYGEAVAGSAICPTAVLMRPALQILRKKGLVVSEVAVLGDVKNNRNLFVTDPSLNISPTPEQLAQMALNAAECVGEFDIKPKVALLSFSTKGSGGDGPEIQIVREALKIIKEKDPKLLVDGEMQFDAAVNPLAASRKCPDSPLKGEANILVFPNLTASNIFAHGAMQLSDMTFGPVFIRGMQKPVAILGRSTPLKAVRNMILGCALQVNAQR